jgi:hypothetical protein
MPKGEDSVLLELARKVDGTDAAIMMSILMMTAPIPFLDGVSIAAYTLAVSYFGWAPVALAGAKIVKIIADKWR